MGDAAATRRRAASEHREGSWTGQSVGGSSVSPASGPRRAPRWRRACGRSRPPRRCGSPRPIGSGRHAEAYALYRRVLRPIPTMPRASPAAAWSPSSSAGPTMRSGCCAARSRAGTISPTPTTTSRSCSRRAAISTRRSRACQRALRFDPGLSSRPRQSRQSAAAEGRARRGGRWPISARSRSRRSTRGAHYQLGLTLQALERLDAAAASCERAVGLQPRQAEATTASARCCTR